MWIFLNDAFFSIVEDRTDPAKLLVRARFRGDIERVFPDATVAETAEADYRFRAPMSRMSVAVKIAELATAIDYTDFKNSVGKPGDDWTLDRIAAYGRIWDTMCTAQALAGHPVR